MLIFNILVALMLLHILSAYDAYAEATKYPTVSHQPDWRFISITASSIVLLPSLMSLLSPFVGLMLCFVVFSSVIDSTTNFWGGDGFLKFVQRESILTYPYWRVREPTISWEEYTNSIQYHKLYSSYLD